MSTQEELEQRLIKAKTTGEKVPALNALAWKLVTREGAKAREMALQAYELATNENDESGITYSLLVMGSYELEYGTLDRAITILEDCLIRFKKLNDLRGQAQTYDSLGWCLYIQGQGANSLEVIQHALNLRENLNDPLEVADSLNSISAIYSDLGQYAEAIEVLLRATNIAEEYNSQIDQVRFMTNIGTIYMEVGEFQQAVSVLEQAIVLAQKLNYTKIQTFALGSLGLVYRELGNFELALEYSLRSLDFPKEFIPKYQKADILLSIGDLYRRTMNLELSKKYLEEGLSVCAEIGDTTTEAKGLLEWGRYLLASGDAIQAIKSLKKGLKIAEKASYQQMIYQIHEALSEAFFIQKRYRTAYFHYKSYHKVKEIIFNRDSIARRRMTEMQFDLEGARQERRVAEALRLTGSVLNTSLDFNQVLDLILEQAQQIVSYQAGSIYLIQDGTATPVRSRIGNEIDISRMDFQERTLLISETSNLQWILETGKPLAIPDTTLYPGWSNMEILPRIRSWVGTPILIGSQIIAFLSLINTNPNAYQPKHAEYLAIYANQAGLALKNARLFEEVQRMAVADSLTGVFNRRHLFELGQREFERNRRYNMPLSVIMLDVDHFKLVNDTYGHQVGDEVLHAIAANCVKTLRRVDIIGRYGGEEFIIFLPEINATQALQTAERLRREIETYEYMVNGQTIQVTVSLGVVELTPTIPRLEALLSEVDKALYRAKHHGRNRVSL